MTFDLFLPYTAKAFSAYFISLSVPQKTSSSKKISAGSTQKTKAAPKTAGASAKKTARKPAVKTASKSPASKAANKNEKSIKKSTTSKKASQPKQPKKEPSKPIQPVEDVILGTEELTQPHEPVDKAELYDEIIAQEMERELIRTQRKQTAGKDAEKKKEQRREDFEAKPRGPITDRAIEISDVITVKEFAEKTGIGAVKIIGELMKNGVLANINQQIDFETAQIIADDFGVKLKKKITGASVQELFAGDLEALLKEDLSEDLEVRPPIVVVMGHVDHGKTSLLDAIRETHVVAKEAGGITQHIGAYQVEKSGRKITFLDTPGHEAFTAMRARGAKVTDIAILVVAADEGVKPQTIEALEHAREAEVPIIVALTKIDKENAAIDRVKAELAEYDLVPEEWGGSAIMVPVSSHTGEGLQTLLDMILLVADMANLKANPHRKAVGTVIEAHLDQNFGPVATVIVNTGNLEIMDNIVVSGTYGRVKVMKDHNGHNISKALPSTPVLIAGLASAPHSGDIFQVVADEKTARSQAQHLQTLRDADLLAKRGVGEIISQIGSGALKQLKLVLKADTKGSLEAIKQALNQIKHEDVGVKVILSGVGNVTESDVMMAAAAQGIVMGFHSDLSHNVKALAEREHVEILQYKVIYQLLDDIRKILTGLLEPEVIETVLGRAEVRQIFLTKKKEMIVGCKVLSGVLRKVKVRVFRKEQLIGEGTIQTLRRFEETVNEVKENEECGILYTGFLPLEPGDVLEAYSMEKRVRTL